MCPIFDHFLSATYGIDDLWDGHGNVSYIPNEEPSLTNEADEETRFTLFVISADFFIELL